MNWEIMRNVILIVGWPVLVGGSFYLILRNVTFYRSLESLWGKFVLSMMTGWLVTMYSLGFVATAFMLADTVTGTKVVLPIFVVWFITMVVIIRKGLGWSQETMRLTSFYRSLDELVKVRTQELHDEHTRLEASINSLNLGFIMTDAKDRIIMINPIARSILFAGRSLSSVRLSDVQAQLKGVALLEKMKDAFKNGTSHAFHDVLLGSRILQVDIVPILGVDQAKPIGTVVLIQDITNERAIERSREEFFSIASHELRTPLTAIRGNTSMLQDMYGDKVADPGFRQMLGDLHDASARLIEIVSDFLDTSRLEQGAVEFTIEAFALPTVIDEAVSHYWSGASGKNLTLNVVYPSKVLPQVLGDATRFRQVLDNLIENALTFTERGGITINLAQTEGLIKIMVTDTGKGIPVSEQHLLFKKFQQANKDILTRDASHSTGLGLYMSKLIMEAMGGKIYLEESAEGRGSTFVVLLPTVNR